MSGWSDLVVSGQPALLGGGLIHEGFTEGRTWLLTLEITDFTGALIDWTDIEGSAILYANRDGGATALLELDVTFPSDGIMEIRKESVNTVGLATQNSALGISLTNTATSEVVSVCNPQNSPCPVRSDD